MFGGCDGGLQFFGRLHLRCGIRRASGIGFDKDGQTQFIDALLGIHFFSHMEQDALGNRNAEGRKITVAGELRTGEGCCQHAATAVGHAYHVEISLQDTILTWGAVDDDIGEVEGEFHAVHHDRKVLTIDGPGLVPVVLLAVILHHLPFGTLDDDDAGLIFAVVNETPDALGTAERNHIFAGVASSYDCDFFH